jgi:prevent-host-death family protein
MHTSATHVGAFEAKTKLSELLERVGQGSTFVITKHEKPVARLVGYEGELTTQRAEATAALRALRQRYTLGGVDAHTLREEGRA